MENSASPAFRTSISGYNKADVNEYILKLNTEYSRSLADKDEEIASLKSELDAANTALNDAKNTATSERELESANNVIAAQTEQLEALRRELDEAKAELSLVKSELDRIGDISDKMDQYENMTTRMGEIYMEATTDADRIRKEAKQAADELLLKTTEDCRERRQQLEARLSDFAAIRKEEIARLLNESQAEIDRVLAIFGEKSRALTAESFSATIDGFEPVRKA